MRRIRQVTLPNGLFLALCHLLWVLSIWSCMVGLTGCGGGGNGNGGGENGTTPPPPPPPPVTTGTASGQLTVPPNSTVEVEPNQTIAQAQPVDATFRVSGNADLNDAGFPLPGFAPIEIEDLYRLNTADRVRITLTIAADDLNANDLDLFLLDSSGNLIDVSEGLIRTEVVETPAAGGDFLVGVRAFSGHSAYLLSFDSIGGLAGAPLASETLDIPADATFVPGQILVKFLPQKSAAQPNMTNMITAYGLTPKRLSPPGIALMQMTPPRQVLQHGTGGPKLRLPGSEANALKALTLDTIRRLRQDPDVVYAEPNFIRHAFRTPDDPFFALQWHYELINLPAAWDVTIGSDDIIVAVIDTGVLSAHPDLSARLVDGFDFIRNVGNANDGDGIDADPSDPGDDIEGQSSSFHGTHVAGTVGATTDNETGVAGVTWQTRIMPLRVLGVAGGTDADIAQAIRFAAGLSNDSDSLPAAPARIINMSLGGPGFSQTLQDAILAARAEGVMVVAAAGNESTSAPQSPAALDGVISVAAVDINSARAAYSNFGPSIDVAAPGGDLSVDVNGDGFTDGVLSTLGNDRGDFLYRFYQGTSMAAPHVAGTLALMLAVNPNLTPADIDQLLAGTQLETDLRITRDLGAPGRDDFFGHGLIDAAAAVSAAGAVTGGTGVTPSGSILRVSAVTLNFDNFLDALRFEITNTGVGPLDILSITDDVPWLTLTPAAGPAPLLITATVDRTGLSEGPHTATIQINSNATLGNTGASIAVTIQVGGSMLGNVGPVFVLLLDGDSNAVAQTVTTFDQAYAFTIPEVAPGTYVMVAGTDRDDDLFICEPEDACGFFSDPVTIEAGQDISGLAFVVGDLIAPQRVTAVPRDLQAGGWMRLR